MEHVGHSDSTICCRQASPTLAIFDGRPGSGKTTLARLVAQRLDLSIVSRDGIFAGIRHSHGGMASASRKEADVISALSLDAFFRIIELHIGLKVSIIAEAAFQDFRWREGLQSIRHRMRLRVVHCLADPGVARERVVRRRTNELANREPRKDAAEEAVATRWPAERPFAALSMPAPALEVVTTAGYDPPLNDVVAFVES